MIIYDGIKTINKVPFLCFVNELGSRVEIPVDTFTSERVGKYLLRLSLPVEQVEHGNDEPSDI